MAATSRDRGRQGELEDRLVMAGTDFDNFCLCLMFVRLHSSLVILVFNGETSHNNNIVTTNTKIEGKEYNRLEWNPSKNDQGTDFPPKSACREKGARSLFTFDFREYT